MVMAGDFGEDFKEMFMFVLPLQRADTCTNPTYNYSEFCSCFYWISECCSSELFLRVRPLAHFEALLAFSLSCKLVFVMGLWRKEAEGVTRNVKGEKRSYSEQEPNLQLRGSDGPIETK